MKLRNKKTGEIWNVWSFYDRNQTINLKYFNNDGVVNLEYSSLAKLNEAWEDYEPTYPLIKDKNHPERAEKARRTLKMWADANGFKRVSYRVDSCVSVFYNECNPSECATTIEFGWIMEGLKPGIYDIPKLCGEEEE